MAFCSKCGKELTDDAGFCSGCGAAVGVSEQKKDNQRKVSFDGEVHKCPNCGEILKGFESVCSACGFEIRGTKTAESVQEFVKKLEALDGEKGGSAWLAHQAFGEGQLSPIEEKKVNLIKNFPIPNTKEDIREFMILASTNLDPVLYESQTKTAKIALMGAWKVKMNQAYQKAKMSFGDGADFRSVHKIYDEKILKPKRKKMTLIGLAIAVPVIVAGVVLALVLL
ncbi:MAG: zinc-ribbon domain-containing protein [Clostridiales bacterium]|nr:zinc-ribbon domain-containing protein [Clostridiales bacterium]